MISIILPQLGDNGGYRDRALLWNVRRWHALCRSLGVPYEVILACHIPELDGPVMSFTAAGNRAIAQARYDTLLIACGDMSVNSDALAWTLREIVGVTWGFPQCRQVLLNADMTDALLQSPVSLVLQRSTHPGTYTGNGRYFALLAATKAALARINGQDEQFTGWGFEDHAAVLALTTLVGPHKSFMGDSWHLWHPEAVEWSDRVAMQENPYYARNEARYQLYREANGNVKAMEALVGLREAQNAPLS